MLDFIMQMNVNGEYQYAYIIIKNEFGLGGSLTMDDESGSTPKTFLILFR